jgi:hypothetical protein
MLISNSITTTPVFAGFRFGCRAACRRSPTPLPLSQQIDGKEIKLKAAALSDRQEDAPANRLRRCQSRIYVRGISTGADAQQAAHQVVHRSVKIAQPGNVPQFVLHNRQ